MYQEVINKKTEHLLSTLVEKKIVEDFYLAGGTALALQFGHRKSIDLDWFNQKDFNTEKLKGQIKKISQPVIESEEENTLDLILNEVKLSFFGYKYKLLYSLIEWDGAKLADYRDIACMKIDAISSRGSKKDFIDLSFILKKLSLSELLEMFDQKYTDVEFNRLHILKSLDYFDDADNEPMPNMLENISWREIKKSLRKMIQGELK